MDSKVDFIGIGVTKCGTSWCSDMLAAHPDICMSEPKEVRYFNPETDVLNGEVNPNRSRGDDWYHLHFKHCSAKIIKGEFTPMYLGDPRSIDAIVEYNDKVKLIVCFRDPVQRLNSHYHMMADYVNSTQDALEVEIERHAAYLEQGFYGKQLQYVYSKIPREQVLVLFTEDIHNQPDAVVERLYTFLGVDASYRPRTLGAKSNDAVKSRFPWVGKLLYHLPRVMVTLRLNGLLVFLRKFRVDEVIRRLLTKKMVYQPVSAQTRAQLQQRYLSDIELLESLTSRDLSHWKQPH
jgi:hypothetical protein